MQWGAHVTLATGLITIALGEASRLAPSPALSIACGLLFVSGILSAQLGAILPDLIDFAFARVGLKHRNRATHGVSSLLIPFFLVVFMWGLFIICWPLISVVIWGIALGLPTGWGSHLLLDALNPSGIPLSSKTFTWDWAPYDSPAGNRVLKKVGGICLLAGTLTLVDPVYPLFLPLFAIENWVGLPSLLWVAAATFVGLCLVPFLDRSPNARPGQRRVALTLGAVVLLVLVGLALLAWFTKGVEHIGSLLATWT